MARKRRLSFSEEGLVQYRRYVDQLNAAETRAAFRMILDNHGIGMVVGKDGAFDIHRVVLARSGFLIYYVVEPKFIHIVSVWPGRSEIRPLEE